MSTTHHSLVVRLGVVLIGVIGMALGVASPSHATTLVKKSFANLVLEADLIAVARVTAVNAYPTRDGHYAYTYVDLSDLEVLKGTYTDTSLTLRADGGPLGDGRSLLVPGIPRFAPDERVVVFVKGNGHWMCPLVGWSQGLLRLVYSNSSGVEVVVSAARRAIHGVRGGEFQLSDDAAGAPQPEPDADAAYTNTEGVPAPAENLLQELTLSDLRNEIREVVLAAGPAAEAVAAVESATLSWDGPGERLDRALE